MNFNSLKKPCKPSEQGPKPELCILSGHTCVCDKSFFSLVNYHELSKVSQQGIWISRKTFLPITQGLQNTATLILQLFNRLQKTLRDFLLQIPSWRLSHWFILTPNSLFHGCSVVIGRVPLIIVFLKGHDASLLSRGDWRDTWIGLSYYAWPLHSKSGVRVACEMHGPLGTLHLWPDLW